MVLVASFQFRQTSKPEVDALWSLHQNRNELFTSGWQFSWLEPGKRALSHYLLIFFLPGFTLVRVENVLIQHSDTEWGLIYTSQIQQSFREERKLELETLFCQIKIEVEWNWRRKLLVISTQKYILKRLNQFSGKPLNCFSKTVDKSETGMSVMSLHINWTNNIAVLA